MAFLDPIQAAALWDYSNQSKVSASLAHATLLSGLVGIVGALAPTLIGKTTALSSLYSHIGQFCEPLAESWLATVFFRRAMETHDAQGNPTSLENRVIALIGAGFMTYASIQHVLMTPEQRQESRASLHGML